MESLMHRDDTPIALNTRLTGTVSASDGEWVTHHWFSLPRVIKTPASTGAATVSASNLNAG